MSTRDTRRSRMNAKEGATVLNWHRPIQRHEAGWRHDRDQSSASGCDHSTRSSVDSPAGSSGERQ